MEEATVAEENAQIRIITSKRGNKIHRIITREEATIRLICKILLDKHGRIGPEKIVTIKVVVAVMIIRVEKVDVSVDMMGIDAQLKKN
jgi:hypothetical protein